MSIRPFQVLFLFVAVFGSLSPVHGDDRNLETAKEGPLGMIFITLQPGTFYYFGSSIQDGAKTNVSASFEIAIYTVTQGQWQTLMANNPSFFSRDGLKKEQIKDISDEKLQDFPIENVTWADAQKFLKKLNEQEQGKGYVYRMPTEVEWEYACRGGATSKENCRFDYYLDKPTNDLTGQDANFRPTSGGRHLPALGRTAKVGSYPPNKIGLYDMHGNVRQWCVKEGDSFPESQISRGGSWDDFNHQCRIFDRRGHNEPDGRGVGLRVVRVPDM